MKGEEELRRLALYDPVLQAMFAYIENGHFDEESAILFALMTLSHQKQNLLKTNADLLARRPFGAFQGR